MNNSTQPANRRGDVQGVTHHQRFWIAVASAEHVAIGRQLGIMQVCHGKAGPLRRLQKGDAVTYYSAKLQMQASDPCQSFTATGVIADNDVYQVDMGGGFRPYRRRVVFAEAAAASIRPLLNSLNFTRGRTNWGYAFRYGLLEISADDHQLIVGAMLKQPGRHCRYSTAPEIRSTEIQQQDQPKRPVM
jgi:hypothetical protein